MTRRAVLLAAEAALVMLTVVVTISLERLFTDTSYLPELLILVIGSHVVAAVCRRAELAMMWTAVISGLALVMLGTAVFYSTTSAIIVPTRETLSLLGDDLRVAWQVFSEDASPVPPVRGFVVTTGVLVWFGAFLADWAAFRLRSPLEAVAPATAVFVFAALLGVDRHELSHGLLFAFGLLAVLLTLRAERQAREEVWVAVDGADGVRTTLRVGAAAGAIAVVVGALVAPQLPGATAQPLVDITEISTGPQSRSVLSPLVEISTSLITQSDLELFSVEVDEPERDYWRLMALTKFEDQIWRRSSNFDAVRGAVDTDIDSTVATRSVTQEITIAALGNIYLPAAYEVSDVVDSGGIDVEYEAATGALVVERGLEEIPRELTYVIESQVPDYRPEDLPADASDGLDEGFVAEHTQLPPSCQPQERAADTGCWPTGVSDEAERIVRDAGATTDHERVLALQNFFLDPTRFTYDLDVALEHDIDDMNTFLTIGRGYCEQFASTFAAMARSLGIPTRVAVGFTWGDWDPERGKYVVRGKHAHAWPEVYFSGVGWIIFDPTPGRSRGYDGDITGLPVPEQVGSNPDIQQPAGEEPTPGSTIAPGPEEGNGLPVRPPRELPDTTGVAGGGAGAGRGPWVALAILGGLLAFVGLVPATQQLRRRRRLARTAADPFGRAEMAWDDALSALRLIGLTVTADQTPHEFATVVERSRGDHGPVRALAHEVTQLRYSASSDAVDHAIAAQEAAAEIVRRCRAQAGWRQVWKDAFDPRTLWKPPPASMFSS